MASLDDRDSPGEQMHWEVAVPVATLVTSTPKPVMLFIMQRYTVPVPLMTPGSANVPGEPHTMSPVTPAYRVVHELDVATRIVYLPAGVEYAAGMAVT